MEKQLELLKRQYLQLVDPDRLTIPPVDVIRCPRVQAQMYEQLFKEDAVTYPPPARYQTLVLKKLVGLLETAFVDPEEDVCFPCFGCVDMHLTFAIEMGALHYTTCCLLP